MRASTGLLASLALGVAACGARTDTFEELDRGPTLDAQREDATRPDVIVDAVSPAERINLLDAGAAGDVGNAGDAGLPDLCGIPDFRTRPVAPVCTPGAAPVTIANLPGRASSILLDEGAFYMATAAGFGVMAKGGGPFMLLLPSTDSVSWTPVAFDADAAYLNGGLGLVVRVPKQGGCATVLAASDYATAFGIDNAHVYLNRSPSGFGENNEIARVRKTGGAIESVLQGPAKVNYLSGRLVVGGWIFAEQQLHKEAQRTIVAVTTSGATAQTVYDGPGLFSLLAADTSGLYVNRQSGSGGELLAISFPPLGSQKALLSNLPNGGGAATDDTSLYWWGWWETDATFDVGVAKTNKTTGATTLLAPLSDFPQVDAEFGNFRLDDACVYWTVYGCSSGPCESELVSVAK